MFLSQAYVLKSYPQLDLEADRTLMINSAPVSVGLLTPIVQLAPGMKLNVPLPNGVDTDKDPIAISAYSVENPKLSLYAQL